MGIKPDLYSYVMEEKEKNEKYLKNSKLFKGSEIDIKKLEEKYIPKIKNIENPYPYVPYLTVTKAVQDYREGCGTLIRGDDLSSEFSLYCYFCKLLNIPVPEFIYVPRLMHGTISLSKTKGNLKLKDLRKKGYSPEQIFKLLKDACLIDKKKGWFYKNIKPQPVIYI